MWFRWAVYIPTQNPTDYENSLAHNLTQNGRTRIVGMEGTLDTGSDVHQHQRSDG